MAQTKLKPGTLKRARQARQGREPAKLRADVAAGLVHLQAALIFFRFTSPRTAERVRLAISSARGAARHAANADARGIYGAAGE